MQEPGPYKRDIKALEDGSEKGASQFFASCPVTKAIIAVNVVVFLIMAVASSGQSLSQADSSLMLTFGADSAKYTLTGQYWRTLTSVFLHFDLLHIAFNMYALWYFGQGVENLYGGSKMLFVYLFAGLAGSLCSLYFHPSGVSAGASGAVFGAAGALLVFFLRHAQSYKPGVAQSFIRTIVFFVILNLALGMAKTYIDSSAHIGGFIGGALAGLAMLCKDVRQRAWTASNFIAAILIVTLLAAGYRYEISQFIQP